MNKIINKLANKVRDAILNDETINEDMKVDVLEKEGVITLQGSAPSNEHAKKAELIANKQEGVIYVINELSTDGSDRDKDKDVTIPPITPHSS